MQQNQTADDVEETFEEVLIHSEFINLCEGIESFAWQNKYCGFLWALRDLFGYCIIV